MVKKLYKHEFIALLKWIVPVNLFCLLTAAFLRITMLINSNIPDNDLLDIITGLFTITFVISVFGASIAVLGLVIVRFYKHLLSQEGYLTFTIPVTPTAHLTCKLVCGGTVMALTAVASLLSIGVLLIGQDFSGIEEFFDDMSMLGIYVTPEISGAFAVSIVLFVIAAIVGLAHSLLMPYAAMCMGQLSKKNRIVRSVVCYIILSMAINMVTQVLNVVSTIVIGGIMDDMYDVESGEEAVIVMMNSFNVTMLMGTLLSVVCCIAFFLIARHILNNKLNLE